MFVDLDYYMVVAFLLYLVERPTERERKIGKIGCKAGVWRTWHLLIGNLTYILHLGYVGQQNKVVSTKQGWRHIMFCFQKKLLNI